MTLDASSILATFPAQSGDYLFYIGALYVALLLLGRRRWLAAAAVFGVALLWFTYFLSFTVYLDSLGDDSFADAHDFSLEEARFWLFTMGEAIHADFRLRQFIVYTALAVASFHALKFLAARAGLAGRGYVLAKLGIVALLVGSAFHLTASTAVSAYLENSERTRTTERNFRQPAPEMQPAGSGLQLVVYIGESTTVMNMGLYGYPRDTTPRLSALARQDPKLLPFGNVFSTHTHTSGSLLEALSLGLDRSQDTLPINERRRVPLVDVLAQAGVESRLISNQGMRGAWDQASSVIFRNARSTFRIHEELAAPRRGEEPPGQWDDEFFAWQLRREPAAAGPRVTFLHSYAGHGPYAENTPVPFRSRVDDALVRIGRERVTAGAYRKLVQVIEEYDAAVRYVDHSVTRAIERVAASREPVVFVYFSDHGESVFTWRGHDSSRFRHEMVRVPFLLYFNDAARARAPHLFAKYQALAARGGIATLAQLPSTLLDLLGTAPRRAGSVVVTPVIGEAATPAPIVVRRTARGVSYVSLDPEAVDGGADEDTRTYLAVQSGRLAAARACAMPAQTFEEQARRILLARCSPAPGAYRLTGFAPAGPASLAPGSGRAP